MPSTRSLSRIGRTDCDRSYVAPKRKRANQSKPSRLDEAMEAFLSPATNPRASNFFIRIPNTRMNPNLSIFASEAVSIKPSVTTTGSCTSGSLEAITDAIVSERRNGGQRKTELSVQAREALRLAHNQFVKTIGVDLSPALLSLWEHHYRKTTTVNQYANPFRHWCTYCDKEGVDPLPVIDIHLAAWLAAAQLGDTTASPTDNRFNAVRHFNEIAGGSDIDRLPISRKTKEAVRHKLGYKNQSKKALVQDQVDQIVSHFLSQPGIQGLANAFRVALAYEATLRFDDYQEMTLGDFIVTNDFVRVFLIETKTDLCKSGQWATFAASSRTNSAFQLYQKLINSLVQGGLPHEHIALWPIMFKDNSGSFAQIKLSKIPKVTYNDFLRGLKKACSAIGLNPSAFGTHSLRRGSVTDQFLEGIPDRVIKISGRWKSQAFERYIDQEMILRLHLHSIKLMEVNRSWPLTGKRS